MLRGDYAANGRAEVVSQGTVNDRADIELIEEWRRNFGWVGSRPDERNEPACTNAYNCASGAQLAVRQRAANQSVGFPTWKWHLCDGIDERRCRDEEDPSNGVRGNPERYSPENNPEPLPDLPHQEMKLQVKRDQYKASTDP
ncbi:hypothetical protein FB451DRAFT_1189928 [Mycena latifolia]|nr:hypothetical protein FB451DRAFT_1189928 [Mycena latifolia]